MASLGQQGSKLWSIPSKFRLRINVFYFPLELKIDISRYSAMLEGSVHRPRSLLLVCR